MYSPAHLDHLLSCYVAAVDTENLAALELLWHLGDGSRVLEWGLLDQMACIREEGFVR